MVKLLHVGQSVFISHYSPEAPIASELRKFLEREFDGLRVFQSSDGGESLKNGAPQFKQIIDAIEDAAVVIALISRSSVRRPWLAFECGYALSKANKLKPLLVRGTRATSIPSPFSDLVNGQPTVQEIDRILHSISNLTGITRSKQDLPTLVGKLEELAKQLPAYKLALEPYIEEFGNGNPAVTKRRVLNFRIDYADIVPIDLERIEVWIPKSIKANNWNAQPAPGHLRIEHDSHDGVLYCRKVLLANDDAPSCQFENLRRRLAPNNGPMKLFELRFELVPQNEIATLEGHRIATRIVTSEGAEEMRWIDLAKVEVVNR